MSFFDPFLFGYALLYLYLCAAATVAVCDFDSWALVVRCGLPTSNLSLFPATPFKQSSTMGENVRPSSFTIQRCPRISTSYKFADFRYRLPSMALQTVQVSVEPRLSTATHKVETALKDRSVVP